MHRNKNEFVEVGRSDSDWAVLYLDKSDGRYWELSFPSGCKQGGGAPILESRTLGEVTDKYKKYVPD
jgi:hypothetical protein